MDSTPRILLLGGEARRSEALATSLEKAGWSVRREAPLSEVDATLVDALPASEASALVRRLREEDPLVSSLVTHPQPLEGAALLDLGRAGAYDCLRLRDPSDLESLLPRLDAARRRCAHRRASHPVSTDLVGVSDKMEQVRRYIRQAAGSQANVVVLGETGTGKELVARAIHETSPRSEGPFLAVNCAAIPAGLLESELFGHERGAFTGAERLRRGAFELADGGTLFLDEIGEMPPAFQAKLLRVLEPPPSAPPMTREFLRVGGEAPVRSRVRLVAATNVDLEGAVARGEFREDLRERLQVVALHLPPLRDRREDLPLLAEHFLKRFARQEDRSRLRLDPAALEVLRAWHWPGNVRELKGVLRAIAAVKISGDRIVLGDLPPRVFGTLENQTTSGGAAAPGASALRSLDEVEREHILGVLEATDGNKSKAARVLGISRPTLDRRLARYEAQAGDPDRP